MFLRKISSLKGGQATLSMVLLIGGVAILIGITLAVVAAAFINSGQGFRAANQALAAANGALSDVHLRIIRGEETTASYRITIDSVPVDVSMTVGSPVQNQITAIASSTVRGYRRRVQAIYSFSSSTREVDMLSWTQLTL